MWIRPHSATPETTGLSDTTIYRKPKMKNKFCCTNCHKEILIKNYHRHQTSDHCKKYRIPSTTECRYCAKSYNTKVSTANHEQRCVKNPNKIVPVLPIKTNNKASSITKTPNKERDTSKFCCIKCKKEKLVVNYTRHYSSDCLLFLPKCSNTCKFCGEIFKFIKSNNKHEPYCESNPNRKFRKAWNKGKTQHNDSRVAKYVNTMSEKIKSGEYTPPSRPWTDDDKLKHSEIMSKVAQENPDAYGGRYNRFGVKEKVCTNGFKVLGGWEETFVNYCHINHIEIEQPKVPFSYIFEGKQHHYYPDFYLPEHDLYVEVKGLEEDRDTAKWNSLTTIHEKRLVIARLPEIKAIRNDAFNFLDFITNLYMPVIKAI